MIICTAMRVLVVASTRFDQMPDGSLWTANASLRYDFWTRYLDVFQSVRLLVRVRPTREPASPSFRVTGSSVEGIPLPDFRGPLSYIRQRARVRHQTRTGLEQCPALILRIPAIAAWSVFQLREPRRPFGVEVVGDPWEVFAPGRMRTPWRALLRHRQRSIQRRLVRGACAAAYVTRHALQRRYPPPAEGHTTSYSSVVLQEQDFASRPRGFETGGETPRLVTVGSLHQTYKGVDTLLQAIALYCRSWGPLRLLVVGDGKLRPNLERQCRRLGIQDCVDFVGRVADARIVRTYLDQSDMFVLASRTEGLPRAMLEAMARGLPCLGTDVGGITELLDASDLFPADRPEQLAGKLRESLRNPQRLAQMAHRNWSRAKDYREQLLRPRRNLFYSHVAQATQHWLDQIEGGPT